MSVLTKIFVVALVVLSLLLSAATITFVNSIGAYRVETAAVQQSNTSLQAELIAARQKNEADKAAYQEQKDAVNAANQAMQTQIAAMKTAADKAAADLAASNSDATLAKASVDKLTAAVSASEATKALFAQQIADLRGTNDKLQTQNSELNVSLADASNKLSVTEAQRRQLAEQLQEQGTQLEKVSSALKDRGVDPTRISSSGLAAGAPAINGVIRETRTISGIPHAVISLGSEDAVKVGMEFNVLDRTTGKFLGKLTVVAVEPNESIGRLSGPGATSVAQGAEVRTQL